MAIDVTNKVILFRSFLNNTWKILDIFFSDIEYKITARNDFIQGNWELLLETSLDVFLPPFGEGADINGISPRITYPDKEPTHVICCKLKNESSLCLHSGNIVNDLSGYYLEEIVNYDFEIKPPFDFVKLINNKQDRIVIPFNDVIFFLLDRDLLD